MRIIVLDLEFTQPGQKIIQIGAVLHNLKTGREEDRFDMIANPGEVPNEFIMRLTGITPDMVLKARPLTEVLALFWCWVDAKQCGWQLGAWGSDVWELREASIAAGIKPSKIPKNLNIKEMSKVFRSHLPGTKRTGGLLNTLQAFDMQFLGRQHNALDDALNTARLLQLFSDMVERDLKVSKLYSKEKVCKS